VGRCSKSRSSYPGATRGPIFGLEWSFQCNVHEHHRYSLDWLTRLVLTFAGAISVIYCRTTITALPVYVSVLPRAGPLSWPHTMLLACLEAWLPLDMRDAPCSQLCAAGKPAHRAPRTVRRPRSSVDIGGLRGSKFNAKPKRAQTNQISSGCGIVRAW
jgi:hypothetical protein